MSNATDRLARSRAALVLAMGSGPAHLGQDLAGPMLARWSGRHPWHLITLAVLAGGVLARALARPGHAPSHGHSHGHSHGPGQRPGRLAASGLLWSLLAAGLRSLNLPALALALLRSRLATARAPRSTHRPQGRPGYRADPPR